MSLSAYANTALEMARAAETKRMALVNAHNENALATATAGVHFARMLVAMDNVTIGVFREFGWVPDRYRSHTDPRSIDTGNYKDVIDDHQLLSCKTPDKQTEVSVSYVIDKGPMAESVFTLPALKARATLRFSSNADGTDTSKTRYFDCPIEDLPGALRTNIKILVG